MTEAITVGEQAARFSGRKLKVVSGVEGLQAIVLPSREDVVRPFKGRSASRLTDPTPSSGPSVDTQPRRRGIPLTEPIPPEEIRKRITEHLGPNLDRFNQRVLIELGLHYPVYRKDGYPGKGRQLRLDLGLPAPDRSAKWDGDSVIDEAITLYRAHGKLTQKILAQIPGLLRASYRHVGTLEQIKEVVRQSLQSGIVEVEGQQFITENESPTSELEEAHDATDLLDAVSRDRRRAKIVRSTQRSVEVEEIDLMHDGEEVRVAPVDQSEDFSRRRRGRPKFWTTEKIKTGIADFINIHGAFTWELAIAYGAEKLLYAASKEPGGLTRLVEEAGQIPYIKRGQVSAQVEAAVVPSSASNNGDSSSDTESLDKSPKLQKEESVESGCQVKGRKGQKWDDTHVVEQAKNLYQKNGILNTRILGEVPGLSSAAFRHVGTLDQLRERVGIIVFSSVSEVSTENDESEVGLKEKIRGVLSGNRMWIDIAACKEPKQVKIFERGTVAMKKEVCRGCLACGLCLAQAMKDKPKGGVFGGKDGEEREKIITHAGEDNTEDIIDRLITQNRQFLGSHAL